MGFNSGFKGLRRKKLAGHLARLININKIWSENFTSRGKLGNLGAN